jgi:hypothetical protein
MHSLALDIIKEDLKYLNFLSFLCLRFVMSTDDEIRMILNGRDIEILKIGCLSVFLLLVASTSTLLMRQVETNTYGNNCFLLARDDYTNV